MTMVDLLQRGFERLLRLSARTLLTKEPLAPCLEEIGFPGVSASAVINPRSLCFLHIPKTAGASVISVLDSMFDDDEVAKAYNPPDYDHLGPALRRHRFVRGHFVAAQQAKYFPDRETFTIVRNPADLAVSMYRWMRAYRPSDWAEWSKDGRRIAGDDRRLQDNSARATAIALERTLPELFAMDEPVIDERIKTVVLNHLADGPSDDPAGRRARAEAWLRDCVVVGDFDDLQMALWLICFARHWPAPPPLPNIHVNATPSRADESILRLSAEHSPADHALYATGSRLASSAAARLEALAGGRMAVPALLDRRHKETYFANAPRSPVIELHALHAWPGTGWMPRVVEASGLAWRAIGPTGAATILAKLIRGLHYLFLLDLPRIEIQTAVDGLAVDVGGERLERLGVNQSPSGVRVIWDLPARLVAAADGDVEISMTLPQGMASPPPFVVEKATIQVSPYAHGSGVP